MILDPSITKPARLTAPYVLIALTIGLGIYGLYLAVRLRRIESKDAS